MWIIILFYTMKITKTNGSYTAFISWKKPISWIFRNECNTLLINILHAIDWFRWICLEKAIWYFFYTANHFISLSWYKVIQENWLYFSNAWASTIRWRLMTKRPISFMHQSSETTWLEWILYFCNRLWWFQLPVNKGNFFKWIRI